jgi:hypothetical protein
MSFGVGAIGQLAFAESTTDDGTSIRVTPTGVSSTFSVGTVILESIYFPAGVQATFALGTVTVTGTANVIPTGVEAVFAVGDLKLTIWNGVDDSATNTWTVVPTG